jgi:hypothetical protein
MTNGLPRSCKRRYEEVCAVRDERPTILDNWALVLLSWM